jgi:glycosyltransferase involved in cell wall biosynthesis
MPAVLYVSYDGLLEPIGHSQIFQYLQLLAKDHRIVLITFEKSIDWANVNRREALKAAVRTAGFEWVPLRYHKAPSSLAKIYDISVGLLVGLFLAVTRRVGIIHSRSGGPALAIAWPLKRLLRLRLIFDLRGFWADQRAESGFWRHDSLQFRLADRLQARALIDSDCVVSLTHAGVEFAKGLPCLQGLTKYFEVIPTCTNLEEFTPNAAPRPAGAPFTLGIVGSVGVWYRLDEMLDCFKRLRRLRADARLLVVNRDNHALIRDRIEAAGIPVDCVEIAAATHDAVPRAMQRMDAGIFLLKKAPSMAGVAPTKMGEFLACGVPCLANAGIGDVEAVLAEEKAGVVVQDYSAAEKEKAVRELLALCDQPGIRQRCAEAARRRFSLEDGAAAYRRIYSTLEGAR